MSAGANLGRFVIAAPGFSKASASELGEAPLVSSEISSWARRPVRADAWRTLARSFPGPLTLKDLPKHVAYANSSAMCH